MTALSLLATLETIPLVRFYKGLPGSAWLQARSSLRKGLRSRPANHTADEGQVVQDLSRANAKRSGPGDDRILKRQNPAIRLPMVKDLS